MWSVFGIVFVVSVFGRRWWAHDRDRRLIVGAAALFCMVMGVLLVAIAAATVQEEYGFGTLFGANHSRQVLILITLTGLLGFVQLGIGGCLARLACRRAM